MLLKQFLKKALILGAFFIASTISAIAGSCNSSSLSAPENATVKWIYDGDTVLLTDKRKIRIIGIDTPEVKHHKQKAQAYGAKAKEALRELLKSYDYQVVLRYGNEKLDRYSRILAHVYTPDGINISSWLLEQGFARTLSIPPNILLADCYKKSEDFAKSQFLRIWRFKSNKQQDAETLPSKKTGFVRLKARINNIRYNKKSIVMELVSHPKRPIRIKIQKRSLRYFSDIDSLRGQVIEISGVLKKYRGKRTIYLNYPTQIKVLRKKKRIAPVIKWSSENEK